MGAPRERGEVIVNLSDKRLLDLDEFRVYASLGLVRAREVAEASGAVFRVGRKLLIDRKKFDDFCDTHTEVTV